MSVNSTVSGLRNSRAVRWYVLTLPPGHRGASRGLAAEQSRRFRSGEPALEYFAPTYVDMSLHDGKWVRTERPLLYNYVFVRSSESEIYRMMRSGLSLYSFLPRVHDSDTGHYPYLSDDSMETLRWLSSSYSDVLPVCSPEASLLVGGDRVRITEGQFAGVEATVLKGRGRSGRGVVVSIGGWLHVPLLEVSSGQYELVSLNTSGRELKYSRLDNVRLFVSLREALCRHHRGTVTEDDRNLAKSILRQYGNLGVDSGVLRCRLCALLLPCHILLEDLSGFDRLHVLSRELLECVSAEQAKALLIVTLYGCTDNYMYYSQAHYIVDPWRCETRPKRGKSFMIETLSAYDDALGHPSI